MKNKWLAAILSLIIPGVGQIYNGDTQKGIILLLIGLAAGITTSIIIGFIVYPLVVLYAVYDAFVTAGRINSGTYYDR
ncbi:TM2 domain [Rubrobacter radiotolerans]|uniref:TM2 domain n=1 Tax=Rubrobacter radiotolerans TaxID=42256 RepID=A0A023X6L7_RUBRA|nr:hypothetical protein [Rubrobacter radiotolerans]AHY47645.1 TM2 domain [Rubrobacter radiotolerans]MDX5895048.1 hypothetical protein [Rubrobacter radiotolerans]SMC07343.1 hypothetical protein SAMN00767673_2363 [Rubrobacter radiotolerans DSM 5868]